MRYASLMVHLELDAANEARLRVAGDLAERFGSRIIGIAAGDAVPGLYFAEGAYAADLIEQQRAAIKARMAETDRAFRSAVGPRAKALEWRARLGGPGDFVARQARAADLIIVGAAVPGGVDPALRLDTGELVLQAGRPILVVPEGVSGLRAKSILIAWKDTREARRAVQDALPLLKQAEEICVVQVLERDDDKAGAQAVLDDVIAWLAVHDVQATAAVPAASAKSDPLGSLAADMNADLIVAGAYGHSRLREWVWGGMTRDLLTSTRCCSLLSH
ncbi:MAG: universal stress protein [Xanthobacteraceae bacterium]|nr:universal stress protein [Xanthobacteraceae bacterium]